MYIGILSRNSSLYSTDSLVRAAIKRGHEVRVVDHMQCDLVLEMGRPRVFYQGSFLEEFDAIIPRIGSSATNYGAAVVRQFMGIGCKTTLDPGALLMARDKLHSLQILATNGVDVPHSLVPSNGMYLEELLDEFEDFPKVIKLISGTHGLGVILSENRNNAESVLEAFQKLKGKALLQEFIEEAGGADIRAFVVDGKVIACMKRQAKEGEFRSNIHRGASAQVEKLSEQEERIALKAVRLMGLKVAGVDMLRSSRGPLVLEVNASPGLEGIETTTGIDVASRIIQCVERIN